MEKKIVPSQGTDIMQPFATPLQKDSQLLDPSAAQLTVASLHLTQTEDAYMTREFLSVADVGLSVGILD